MNYFSVIGQNKQINYIFEPVYDKGYLLHRRQADAQASSLARASAVRRHEERPCQKLDFYTEALEH